MDQAQASDDRELRTRYLSVLERLENAVCRAGRKAGDVALIAVSKLHPAQAVARVAGMGQTLFGENYVQEALEKRAELERAGLAREARWHMIGHVQSRKAALVAGAFDLVHTLDSVKLADELNRRCLAGDVFQDCLVEVNVGGEAQKSGVEPQELPRLALHVLESCPRLRLQGLMCIPPVYDARAAAQPYFAELRHLRDRLQGETGLALPHLSMGMSGDFEWAVLEGATFVRVGTDIFGPRPVKPA
ncbi:MAG: YggS family pyridoxal phosphate-dependent enzyme [Desulfovibrio sp.]|nr:YggS family pyridoxal phosphate-dependent enzyme [Desulfovibrio sp.]